MFVRRRESTTATTKKKPQTQQHESGHPSPALERFQAKFAITDSNLEEGSFRGVASVFGSVVDAYIPTIIEPGAFSKTLVVDRPRIKVLWQHETWNPIGKPTAMAETAEGLEVAARISQTALGRDCLTLIRDGVVDELSIGFDPVRWEMRQGEDGRELTRHIFEARLWEFSPVTFAADPLAKIQAVHAAARRAIDSEDLETAAATLPILVRFLRETHEGKVLSGKNRTLVQDALTALQALLDAAAPKATKDGDDDEQARPPVRQDADEGQECGPKKKQQDESQGRSAGADAHQDEQRRIAARVAHQLRTLDLDVLESGASFALTS